VSSEHVEVFVAVSDVFAVDAHKRTPLHLLFIDNDDSMVWLLAAQRIRTFAADYAK
jgi:hypothetical protein